MKTEATFAFLALLLAGCAFQQELPFDEMKLALVEEKTAPKNVAVEETSEGSPVSEKEEVSSEIEPDRESEATTKAVSEEAVDAEPAEKSTVITPQDEVPLTVETKVRLEKGEYVLPDSLKILPEGSLEIAPGAKIELQQCGIFCEGQLTARGTEEQPVVFFGTFGWDNIVFSGEKARAELKHCSISGGVGFEMAIVGTGKYAIADEGDQAVGGALLFFDGARGKVEKCTISNSTGKGAVALIEVSDVEVRENHIYNNDEFGIFISGGSPEISQNKIENHSEAGILCEADTNAKIEKNEVFANGNSGFRLNDVAQPTIVENTIEAQVAGIICLKESKGIIRRNTIRNNKRYGMVCSDQTSTEVVDNEIDSNGQVGLVFEGKAGGTMSSNNVSNHAAFGIAILSPTSVTLDSNTISGSQAGIRIIPSAQIEKADTNTVTNCRYPMIKQPLPRKY